MISNAWCRSVAYRDFHDVPRYVLATNGAEDAFWILDAAFDDAVDEYSSIYTIHDAGCALDEAMACFELQQANRPPSLHSDAFPSRTCNSMRRDAAR